MAGDLSTDSFIVSLKILISRRGNSIIFSDNGTNLVGAGKELRLALKNVDFDLVTSKLSPYNTEWKFMEGEDGRSAEVTYKTSQTVIKISYKPSGVYKRNTSQNLLRLVNAVAIKLKCLC